MSKRNCKQPPKSLTGLGCVVDPGAVYLIDKTKSQPIKLTRTLADLSEEELNELYERRLEILAVCGCRDAFPATCYLRKRRGAIGLCSCPIHGQVHEPDCKNWPPRSGAHRDRMEPDGARSVLSDPLFNPSAINTAVAGSGDELGDQKKRDGTRSRSFGPSTLAASLLMLIDAARLNWYDPLTSSADWNQMSTRLANAVLARGSQFGEVQRHVSLLPKVIHAGRLVNRHSLPRSDIEAGHAIRPAMIVGSIQRITRTKGKVLVRLEGESLDIEFNSRTWAYAVKHSPSLHTKAALEALGDGDRVARVLGAFAVTWCGGRDVRGHRCGVCATTREGIPVASSHELVMANHLVALARVFVKDLVQPEGSPFLHDFRIIDMIRDVLVEVNGMNTPEYLARKAEVEAYLKEHHPGGYVIWRAYLGEAIPEIPPSDRNPAQ